MRLNRGADTRQGMVAEASQAGSLLSTEAACEGATQPPRSCSQVGAGWLPARWADARAAARRRCCWRRWRLRPRARPPARREAPLHRRTAAPAQRRHARRRPAALPLPAAAPPPRRAPRRPPRPPLAPPPPAAAAASPGARAQPPPPVGRPAAAAPAARLQRSRQALRGAPSHRPACPARRAAARAARPCPAPAGPRCCAWGCRPATACAPPGRLHILRRGHAHPAPLGLWPAVPGAATPAPGAKATACLSLQAPHGRMLTAIQYLPDKQVAHRDMSFMGISEAAAGGLK